MIQHYNNILNFDETKLNQIMRVLQNWQKKQLSSHEKSNEADQNNPKIYPRPFSLNDFDEEEYNVGGSRTRRRRKPVLPSKRKKTLKKKKSSRR